MDAAETARLHGALRATSAFVAAASLSLPWALAVPFSGIVATYTRQHFNGKPLPPTTNLLIALRPFGLTGVGFTFLFALVVSLWLVRSGRDLFFCLVVASVLSCLAFSFVAVSLVLPFWSFVPPPLTP